MEQVIEQKKRGRPKGSTNKKAAPTKPVAPKRQKKVEGQDRDEGTLVISGHQTQFLSFRDQGAKRYYAIVEMGTEKKPKPIQTTCFDDIEGAQKNATDIATKAI